MEWLHRIVKARFTGLVDVEEVHDHSGYGLRASICRKHTQIAASYARLDLGHQRGPTPPTPRTTLGEVQYQKKPHSHIVPAGYLRAWADGKQIAMRRVGAPTPVVIGVRDAGVQKDFYRRERPTTGEAIYDIEWSLEQGEQAAIPVVRDVVNRWPLQAEEKSKIGQFLALQHVRGPAFRTWHEGQIARIAAELRADPKTWGTPPQGMTHEKAVERYITQKLMSDTYRLTQMLKMVRSVGTVLHSMHWTLIMFKKGRLATSDHPVVVWPLARGRSRPVANDLDAGVTDTLEVFVPLAPDVMLLMTWVHDQDRAAPVNGDGRQLATANAFVIANSEEQWFHEPGVEPWTTKGTRAPLSADLVAGYGSVGAGRSPRRAEAIALAKSVAEADISNDPLPMVTVTRAGLSSMP